MQNVVVGMSGGVDSTAAVYLLQKAGFSVHGLTLWLCGDEKGPADAARVARELGISHTVLDMRSDFEALVKAPFRAAYTMGKTPNPCVFCNAHIKFSALLAFADANGFSHIATGHYASISEENGVMVFQRSCDVKKDQTYFLTQVPPSILPRLLLPLGAYAKDEVRTIAAEAGLSAAEKADSQEICFVPGNDYISYLESKMEVPPKEGKILDANGYMVGLHSGIHRYTVGQRKGLGAFGKKVFVTKIDAEQNTVTIGENDALFSRGLCAENLNMFLPMEGEVFVKIRSAASAVAAVCSVEGNEAHITFRERQRAVTPGQTVAVYRGDTLLGGGTIREPF